MLTKYPYFLIVPTITCAIITSGLSSPAKCLLLQKETVEQRRYLACVLCEPMYRYACDPSESASTLQQQALSAPPTRTK